MSKANLRKNRKIEFVNPEKARLSEVELVHSIEYIDLVKAVCKSGGGLLDLEDTVVSPESYDVALYAVGGTIRAINLVINEKFQNAFALVRPPGHHASRYRACGFCIFNNVAIGAEYLRRKFGLKRILILDIDAHHGNGTQETFYHTQEVLYISLHQNPRDFPGTGFMDEIGENEGLGYTVNIPLPYGTSDQVYLEAVEEIVKPIVKQYRPQFMLTSAGLDGHYGDPVANLSLSTFCYQELYSTLTRLALETCNGKLVSVLEGGYNTKFVGKMATTIVAKMSGISYDSHDIPPTENEHAKKEGGKVLKEVKEIQEEFWNIE